MPFRSLLSDSGVHMARIDAARLDSMSKRPYPDGLDDVSEKVLRLWRSRKRMSTSDKQLLIEDIKHNVAETGVDEDNLERLFDAILENSTPTNFSVLQKKYMVKELCIPSASSEVSPVIFNRILSAIGEPRVYFANGVQTKQHRLPRNLQIQLLEWLLCCLHLFEDVFALVYRKLPVLLHMLSYEFCRGHISQLVFVALVESGTRNGADAIRPLKSWHVKLVFDLHLKFPLDDHLKLLLVLFTKIDPSVNYRAYTNDAKLAQISVSGTLFRVPDDEFFSAVNTIQDNAHRSRAAYLVQLYAKFEQNCKSRRGYRRTDFEPTPVLNEGEVSITDINDLEELVRNFKRVNFPNAWLVLALQDPSSSTYMTNKMRLLYVTLRLLAGDEKLQSEMLYFTNTSLDEHTDEKDAKVYFDRLNRILAMSAGVAAPDLNAHFLLDTQQDLANRITLLKFETLPDDQLFTEAILLPPECEWKTQHHFSKTVLPWLMELTSFLKWWLHDLRDQDHDIEDVVHLMNKIFSAALEFLSLNIEFLDVSVLVLAAYLLKFAESMEANTFNLLNDHVVLLPSMLCSKMIFSKNPFVVSGLCGYLLRLKKRQFRSESAKAAFTTLLRDVLNYLWCDKAFEVQGDGLAQTEILGLQTSLVDKLGALPTFSYSNILERTNSGNMFHNSAFAYIACHIVRKQEDSKTDIETRHDGPITRSSVAKLNADAEVQWLGLNYDELREKFLESLEEAGFHGFCNLLYNSISSLAKKRGSD